MVRHLRNVIVSGYLTFIQINKFFVNNFSLLTKCLCGPDEMALRAGFGPRVVVWRPLLYGTVGLCVYSCCFTEDRWNQIQIFIVVLPLPYCDIIPS